MQWTAQLATRDQTLCDRPTIMRAVRAHGEELLAAAGSQNYVAIPNLARTIAPSGSSLLGSPLARLNPSESFIRRPPGSEIGTGLGRGLPGIDRTTLPLLCGAPASISCAARASPSGSTVPTCETSFPLSNRLSECIQAGERNFEGNVNADSHRHGSSFPKAEALPSLEPQSKKAAFLSKRPASVGSPEGPVRKQLPD